MLLSMTGFGAAASRDDTRGVSIQVRAVNNRFLKIGVKVPESHAALESVIEKTIREQVRRGTVTVSCRLSRQTAAGRTRLNMAVLENYRHQLEPWAGTASRDAVFLARLLTLPGVIDEPTDNSDALDDWVWIEPVLMQAIEQFQSMRQTEGMAMAREMARSCDVIAHSIERIAARSPEVVLAHRERLAERVETALRERDLADTFTPSDLLREMAIFSERIDIREELVRLQSHLAQFRSVVSKEEGAGRKLDFVTQEMYREANTIGSKANDAGIASLAVDLKTEIERIRELVQNVE